MQQSMACLHFAWRTTSLRVGGRAARRSCLPGLRRGGGGRQAGAAVLSCLVWRCELWIDGRTSAFWCRSASSGRTAPPDTHRHRPDTERTRLAIGPTQFTPPHQTRRISPVCGVLGVAVWISFHSQYVLYMLRAVFRKIQSTWLNYIAESRWQRAPPRE